MELAYKTIEMGDPRGKAKVYFSCHPDDVDRAFEGVTDDVLRHAACAIWYDAQPSSTAEELTAAEREEFLAILGDMQLVVIAVTARFLRSPSRARDLVLPHALERHIPVLPIMLDPGLEYEFNEVCAPIQVVNRQVTDPTATPYEEVLQSFLDAVIVGDELAARVRDAFDAYVFLSYRKKDRRHAQRLMRLIHDNEAFRDIAIWYDEYLVPGEGFDAAIRAAFEKSSIFALAVTPNLLEPGNYVMDVEFPLARDRHADERDLEIVPVEMYELDRHDPRTDRTSLAKEYDKIPPVQDEHRPLELDDALVEALNRVSRKTSDGSARHRFFIGLAYLNGIDVEPNHERALALISEAANEPWPEGPAGPDEGPCIYATEKLVDMYRTGDGVGRDLDQALRWQRQAAEQWRVAYEREHDPDEHCGYGTRHLKALLRLLDLLRETEDNAGALAVGEEALAFAAQLTEEVGVREVDRDRAVILNRLGLLYLLRRETTRAEDCYRQALRSYERLAGEIGSARARRDLSIGHERLGDLRRRQHDLDAADTHYRAALELRERLEATYPTPQAKRDLSVALTKLGNVERDRKHYEDALALYQRARDIDRILAAELKTERATDDWCVSTTKVADALKGLGRPAEAAELYDQARHRYEELVAKGSGLTYRRNLARCQGKLASAQKHAGWGREADGSYRAAIALWEEICAAPQAGATDTHELALAYTNYALFSRDVRLGRKAMDLWAELAARDPRYRRYLDSARKRFGAGSGH